MPEQTEESDEYQLNEPPGHHTCGSVDLTSSTAGHCEYCL